MENATNSLAYSGATALSSLLRGMRRWYHERRMATALEALDDATLKDIGICRWEMPGAPAPSAHLARHDMSQPLQRLRPIAVNCRLC